VTTMVVLVNLREGVSPEDYERWVEESYAPAVKTLPSVREWRAYQVGGLLASDNAPPYRYVVIVDISDLTQLGRDMNGEEMQGLLSELHRFAAVVQLVSERLV
jgi:REDY-like protein HapK